MSFRKTFMIAVFIVMGSTLFNCSNVEGKVQKIETIEVIDSTNNEVVDILGGISDSIKSTPITSSIAPPPPIPITGKIITMGMMEVDYDKPYSFYNVENVPEFLNTPNNLSKKEKRDYFSKQMSQFVTDNFNENIGDNLGLKGKQKIYVRFIINKLGNIDIIKIRAPHPRLEKETKRVIKMLPQFIPGKEPNNKATDVSYTLPITFNIE